VVQHRMLQRVNQQQRWSN